MFLTSKGILNFGNCDVSFFFSNDFAFPYRAVDCNILGQASLNVKL